MAVLDVVLYPSDPLLSVARPVDAVTKKIANLAYDMFDTMDAHEGVGLAAPQVGVDKRLFVLNEPYTEQRMALVNPVILDEEGREEGEEGCLSLPQIYTNVPRAVRIRVEALDIEGRPMQFEAEGLLARIIQHELDHLNGLIFLDRVDVLTRQAKLQEWETIRDQISSALDRT